EYRDRVHGGVGHLRARDRVYVVGGSLSARGDRGFRQRVQTETESSLVPSLSLSVLQTYPFCSRYSAINTAPLAAPILVLWLTSRYLTAFSRALSLRRRPTEVAMPSSASRSRRGCGRKGSSCTIIMCLGVDGRRRLTNSWPNSIITARASSTEQGLARAARTASVWPSSTAARVQEGHTEAVL